MAKKKKRAVKKAAASNPPKKKAAKKKTAKVTMGKSTDAPGQQALPTMDDVKVSSVESCIKNIVKCEAEILVQKEKMNGFIAKLPGLFKKHDLERYSHAGRSVTIEPGVESVKIRKVNKK